MRSLIKLSALVLAGSVASSAAFAGGYSRGSANLDPLFEGPNPSFTSSFAYVAPDRGYATINGVNAGLIAAPGLGSSADKFTDSYVSMAGTVAVSPLNNVRCAGSYANPFGANADYGWSQLLATSATISNGGTTTSTKLSSDEVGLTCAYGFDVGPGRAHLFGGAFIQSVDYEEDRAFGFDSFATGVQGGDISLSDQGIGYRMGVAYTIPEVAFKAVLAYRSAVEHDVTGIVRNAAFPGGQVNAFATAKLPQSVKLSVQSGVAPGWLVFGSAEWTDWSVLQQVQVFANPGQLAATAVPLPGVSVDAFFNDTWTLQAGVGHKFNDMFSASASVTWDQSSSKKNAVSDFTDTWTFALGGSYQASEALSIRGGLAYSLLTSGTANQLDGDVVTFDNDHSIAGGLSMVAKF